MCLCVCVCLCVSEFFAQGAMCARHPPNCALPTLNTVSCAFLPPLSKTTPPCSSRRQRWRECEQRQQCLTVPQIECSARRRCRDGRSPPFVLCVVPSPRQGQGQGQGQVAGSKGPLACQACRAPRTQRRRRSRGRGSRRQHCICHNRRLKEGKHPLNTEHHHHWRWGDR